MQTEERRIEAPDGHPIAVTLFYPNRPAGLSVLIGSATGAPRRYYRNFASHLAARGCTVLSFDYRGIGDSIDPMLPGGALRFRDWGLQDMPAALDLLHEIAPGHPIVAVGHSAGGQMLGLLPNNDRLAAAVTVGSQLGHWGYWPSFSWRWRMRAITVLSMPLTVRSFGRLPGIFMGGVSLPAGIALEWARWCGHPHYYLDERGAPHATTFSQMRAPVRLYAISDDHFYAPASAVAALQRRFTPGSAELVVRQPKDWGLREVGHFGFFRTTMPRSAWDEVIDWLAAAAQVRLPADTVSVAHEQAVQALAWPAGELNTA